MFESNESLLRRIDEQALQFDQPYGVQDIFDLDLATWQLLRTLANENIKSATLTFGVSEEIATLIASASDGQLRLLSSKAILSFTPKFEETTIKEVLNWKSNDIENPMVLLRRAISMVDQGEDSCGKPQV